jgi:hypothetical protein
MSFVELAILLVPVAITITVVRSVAAANSSLRLPIGGVMALVGLLIVAFILVRSNSIEQQSHYPIVALVVAIPCSIAGVWLVLSSLTQKP